MSGKWSLHWVPSSAAAAAGGTHPVVARFMDLEGREAGCHIDPGDPFFLDPRGHADARLTRYFTRSPFARLSQETKRNYATDCRLFFDFLWARGKNWSDASEEDWLDYEDWRRWSPRNPTRIGDAKWNRDHAAVKRFYDWAVHAHHVADSPIPMRIAYVRGVGHTSVPATRASGAKSSDVRWLTPRAYRVWRDVGLRGYTAEGSRDPGWGGRNDDRNAAYADLLFCSGMRRSEGGSLLTIELPALDGGEHRYFDGRLAGAVTKSRRGRTFYVEAATLRAIDTYCRTTRRSVIRRAQAIGRYDRCERWIVTGRTGRRRTVLHLVDGAGESFDRALDDLRPAERVKLFVEGPTGLEPMWLWLAENGMPFSTHSWETVYQAASARCEAKLTSASRQPLFMTPHMARHSFALQMLVALHHAMDQRFGLTPEERRDFRLLYGDPWLMVRDLLGHRSLETTRTIYLAPVSDLQVRSLLLDEVPVAAKEILASIARESGRVLDTADTE